MLTNGSTHLLLHYAPQPASELREGGGGEREVKLVKVQMSVST